MSPVPQRWFDDEMKWKSWTDDGWIVSNPPLPAWLESSSCEIPAMRFVQVWHQSEALNDVQKELFWLSHQEIEQYRHKVSTFLQSQGYEALPSRSIRKKSLLTVQELEFLLEEGFIQRSNKPPPIEPKSEGLEETTSSEELEDYDPMLAMLEASKTEAYEPLKHIQTSESGGLRFRVRH